MNIWIEVLSRAYMPMLGRYHLIENPAPAAPPAPRCEDAAAVRPVAVIAPRGGACDAVPAKAAQPPLAA